MKPNIEYACNEHFWKLYPKPPYDLGSLCWKKLDFAIMKRKFIDSTCENLTPITKELGTIVIEMALGKTLKANKLSLNFIENSGTY